MRLDLAQELIEILENGNFKSHLVDNYQVGKKIFKHAVIIEHDEVVADLALQHIQEHINEDINFQDGDWVYEFGLEEVNNLNRNIQEKTLTIY